MAVEDVGARLVLSGKAEFIDGMKEAAGATREFQKALSSVSRTTLSLDSRLAALKATTAATKDVTAATSEAVAIEDAAAAASGRRVSSADKEHDAIRRTTRAAEDHVSRLETLAKNPVIKQTALWGTGALALGAYESVKKYTDFNKLITQSAVDAGVKVGNLKDIQKNMLDLSATYGVNMNDVANTWYRIASSAAGTHATMKQMKQYTTDALKLDVLFNIPKGMQTEQTSRIMGAMLNAHLPGARTPDQIMALMNAGVGHGDIRGADMVSALGKATSAASFTGVRAVDLVAWIDTLTKLGMQGSQAGTLINHSVQQLTTGSSEQAQKALLSIGINPGDMSKVTTTYGLPAAIQYLMDKIAHGGQSAGSYFPTYKGNAPGQASATAQQDAWLLANPQAMADWRAGKATPEEIHTITAGFLSKMFGAAKSASPLLALASDPQKLADLTSSIERASTPQALQESMRTAMNTPGRQMDIARASLAKSEATVGQTLTPYALSGLNALKDIAAYFADHKDALVAVLGAITGLVTVAVGVTVASKIASLASNIGKIFGVLGSFGSSVSSGIYKVSGGVFGTAKDVATGTSAEVFAGAVTEFAAAVTEFAATSGGGGVLRGATSVLGGGGGVLRGATIAGVGAEAGFAAGGVGIGVAAVTGAAAALIAGAIVAGVALYIHHNSKPYDPNAPHPVGTPGAPGTGFFPYQTTSSYSKPPGGKPQGGGLDWTKLSDLTGRSLGPGGANPLVSEEESQYYELHGYDPRHPHRRHGKPHAKTRVERMLEASDADLRNIQHVSSGYMNGQYVKNIPSLKQFMQMGSQAMPSAQAIIDSHASRATRDVYSGQLFAGGLKGLAFSKGESDAGNKLQSEAAKLLKQAGDKHTEAANKQRDSASKLHDAAQKHFDAAAKLATVAQQMEDAAAKLGNTQIKASIDLAAFSAAMTLSHLPTTSGPPRA